MITGIETLKTKRQRELAENAYRKAPYVIGIDPAAGWAVYSRVKNAVVEKRKVTIGKIIVALTTISALEEQSIYLVVCEAPYLIKPVWYNGKTTPSNMRNALHIAQSVGMNKAYAKTIIEYCTLEGIPVIPRKPSGKKWDFDTCKAITGIEEKSQDVRDAIRFCFLN